MYKKTVLNNGTRIITHQMPERESVAVGVWIKAGGRYESQENKGAAHFLEHLCFKGSPKYSCRQIKESIEGIGGSLNGFTSEEVTCYFAKLPRAYLDKAIDILLEMTINARLNYRDIEKERFVILEEIKMHKDIPQSYIHELLDELMWPGHPLGMPIAGFERSVSRIRRKDLVLFQKEYYHPANLVIAACGSLKHNQVIGKVESILGKKTSGKRVEFRTFLQSEEKEKVKIFVKDTQQTQMALGWYGLKRNHPDRHKLALLHIVLGANMSSRLFNEIREKRGLAYSIATSIKGFVDTGVFLVQAGVDNEKLDVVLELILREMQKIKTINISESELHRAKEFYIGQLHLGLEDTLEHMFWLGEPYLVLNKTHNLKEIVAQVATINRVQIRALCQKLFLGENLRLAIIGPIKKKKEIYERINNYK